MKKLEQYFQNFRRNIIGSQLTYNMNGEPRNIIYADWAASGRLYRPIEQYIHEELGPFVANTHTEATLTGTVMTHAYHQAGDIIKRHVNAGPDDVLLCAGFGMTAVINKFQRILGLKAPEKLLPHLKNMPRQKPLVIITHMEHHSNQTTWEECLVDVAIVRRAENGLPDLEHLRQILDENVDRSLLIGSFSACSNVTGITTPYHQMAALMHEHGGYCFVDFSASAPYVDIDMHPAQTGHHLDAVFFSPHKFLGGPGSSGVIIFNKELYQNAIPDHPGGGTVLWTNPWGGHRFFDDIEVREDGGTPGFLQAIRTALAILLKEEMGVDNITRREHYLCEMLMSRLDGIDGVFMLEGHERNRVGFISFYSVGVHHNLIVQALNDFFGIQTRGGCSCAGTYGHVLLDIDAETSREITDMIDNGDLSRKPGWVRISLHPTMLDTEVNFIADAIGEIMGNPDHYAAAYDFDRQSGNFTRKDGWRPVVNIRETFMGRIAFHPSEAKI